MLNLHFNKIGKTSITFFYSRGISTFHGSINKGYYDAPSPPFVTVIIIIYIASLSTLFTLYLYVRPPVFDPKLLRKANHYFFPKCLQYYTITVIV